MPDLVTLRAGQGTTILRLAPPTPGGRRILIAPLVGAQGPAGPAGGASYAHHQATPAALWTITHNLGRRPPVVLLDEVDPTVPVYTDLHYLDDNTIAVEWPQPTAGYAYL